MYKNMRPLINGITVGATVGAICYMVCKSSRRQKCCLKRNTGRALRAVGSIVEDFSSMMHN